MITFAPPQVAVIQVGSLFGTCFALNDEIIVTAGHEGQAVGSAATITVGGTTLNLAGQIVTIGGTQLHGTVEYIGGPGVGETETAAAVPGDYAIILLSAPETILTPVHTGAVQDGSLVTENGYPGMVHTITAATLQTTQITGLSVTNQPLAQGSSGGIVYNAQNEVVGITDAFSGGYEYVCDMGMNVEIAAVGVMMGWAPSTIASMEAII